MVNNFNKQKPPPDVQKQEWIACSAPEVAPQDEAGFRQLGDKVCDLLEKQVSVFNKNYFDLLVICVIRIRMSLMGSCKQFKIQVRLIYRKVAHLSIIKIVTNLGYVVRF